MSPRTLPRLVLDPRTALRAAIYGRASSDKRKRGRSIKDQFEDCATECRDRGWPIVDYYEDRDRSASRRATKEREDWDRLVADIEAGKIDVIVYAERSRTNRDLMVYVMIRELCMRTGVLWCYSGRVFDLNNSSDRRETARDAVDSESEADAIADRAERTARLNASRGAPHGKAPYGYARKYDPDEGHLLGQEPHLEHAAVVRDLFARAAAQQSINSLLEMLRQHVPKATRAGLRYMLSNKTYIGIRTHRGQAMDKCQWDPIVDEAVFWEVQAILKDPSRKTVRDTRVKHLLSGLALCAVCVAAGAGEEAGLRVTSAGGDRGVPRYRCLAGNHVAIGRDRLDAFVEDLVFGWLASAEAVAAFHAPASSTEIDRLRTRLHSMQAQVSAAREKASEFDDMGRPLLSIDALALTEQQLLPRIVEAESGLRTLTASQDPLLAGLIGESVQRIAWMWNEEMGMPQRRHVLRRVVNVELRRAAGRGVRGLEPGRVGVVFAGEPGFDARPQRGSAGWVRGS